ncbi:MULTISPECIES: cupin domain-containing protein [unclassified Pseudomonas]|uniref:cupin domain-containing protein n=1 Tax=unclassified Pseudomonas TaxID=196821 RepID=UPI0030DD979C
MNNENPSQTAADVSHDEFTVRRVVTGHDKNGKSVVLADGAPPNVFSTPALPGYISIDTFRTFESPAVIAGQPAETTDGPRRQLPTPNGTVIRISHVPPTNEVFKKLDSATSNNAFQALGNAGGHTGNAQSRNALMHRTETIDYVVVLSGELTLVLDDSEVVLRTGDVLVQCGTNHAWENRSNIPATVMFVLLSGVYDPELTQLLSSVP